MFPFVSYLEQHPGASWVKGVRPPFSFIGTKLDLTHRILRWRIRAVESHGVTVDLRFTSDAGAESHIVLRLTDAPAVMAALRASGRA